MSGQIQNFAQRLVTSDRLSPDQVRNPEEAAAASGRLRSSAMFDAEPDEEGIVANVPRRIASRKPNKQKTQSEINSE